MAQFGKILANPSQFGMTNIFNQIVLYYRQHSAHYRRHSRNSGLCPLNANGNPPTPDHDNKNMSPNISRGPQGAKLPLIQNHWTNQLSGALGASI